MLLLFLSVVMREEFSELSSDTARASGTPPTTTGTWSLPDWGSAVSRLHVCRVPILVALLLAAELSKLLVPAASLLLPRVLDSFSSFLFLIG